MDAPLEFNSFEEFWPYYLAQHLDPICRKLHHVGTGIAIGMLGASVVAPPLALGAPIVGYGFAWVGHFVFEGNVPATFGHPVWSFMGDLKMLFLFLTGGLEAEVERAKELYPQFVKGIEVVPAGADAA